MKTVPLLKALASIKLAVVVIISLGVITAWGTFVEADYGDAAIAQKLVYHSPWMYSVMIILAINLIAVMIDRWPWEKRHTGFVLAHIGLLVLMAGSIITAKFGIDGSMTLGMGEASKLIVVSETDFTVYASLDGASYTKLFDKEVDFFLHPPTPEKPIHIALPDGQLDVISYLPFAFTEDKILETDDEQSGAAIRFQLQNPNVNVTEWLVQPAPLRDVLKDLGPARVVIAPPRTKPDEVYPITNANAIVMRPVKGSKDALEYEIHTARTPGVIKKGKISPGESLETGWMGLVLRVLKYMPHAKQETLFKETNRPTPMTTAAVQVNYNGTKKWLALNNLLKLFSQNAVYVVAFANRRLDVGFNVKLKEFKVGRYQGTMRAASYESLVEVQDVGERIISMNEPLKHKGFTFYQASFNEDERGRPTASVLSVNQDPGRWIKYLGSLIIVLGTIHLFYFKRRQTTSKRGQP